jgi:DNA replication protein DnaC
LKMIDQKMIGEKLNGSKIQAPRGIEARAEVCPLCEGTGWKTAGTGSNARSTNGRVSNNHISNDRRVTRCDCRLRARGESLLAAARIPRRYEDRDLTTFKYEGQSMRIRAAHMAALRFAQDYPLDKTGLLFVGSAGVGKTHLAVGITKSLVEKGIDCLFYDYAELLKQIQNSYNREVQSTELDLLRPVFDAEVLVLDDLGSVKPTEWRWDTIRLILNSRYNDNRTTIITTNFPDKPAAAVPDFDMPPRSEAQANAQAAARKETLGDRIGEPMRSRLHEMCRVVKMDGQDYRQGANRAQGREVSS